MKIIADYAILADCDSDSLEIEVKHMIGHGWEPIGGVSLSTHPPIPHVTEVTIAYAQAMVLYKEVPTPTD